MQARQHPNALIAAPRLMMSPTHGPKYPVPRSPSSDDDFVKRPTDAESVPKAIISTAVTTTKYTPPKIAVPRMARGMLRRASFVSSPSVAAASKPANDRKPNTAPRNTPDRPTFDVNVNTLTVKCCPDGAVPLINRTPMITVTSRISATVAPSRLSRMLVPRLAGATASSHAPTSATATSTNGPHVGGFGQMPVSVRNAVPRLPAADDVTTA